MRPLRAFFTLRALALSAFLPLALAAQGTPPKGYQFAIEDYARAERFLGATMNPLVSGTAGRPTWLPDGRFHYRATTANGASFVLVNPARRTKGAAFDQARLATALGAATGGTFEGDRLPFMTFDLAADGKSLTATVRGQTLRCDLVGYACTPLPKGIPAPSNSSTSPDGKSAVFIRDHNLWLKDLETGRELQLTTDGIKDFGYATNNAGWVHNDNPVVTWSDDSRQIATFQHDGRGVRDMYLVSTNVGAPKLEAWKYPMPGDSVIFRISRVILRKGDDGRWSMVRLQMPPDQHRSTVSDHIACGDVICDTQWYADGSRFAFISSSRDHKQAWLRLADPKTGEVRTLQEEKLPTQ
ncbi:MAG TPA: DPP IV N-terminal domain-containing protein, partial [Gemmatimonadaceae bacterium]|nr:DPP IV N-terminal domain-containing protein [Gemmatimonadaceae bacterium]